MKFLRIFCVWILIIAGLFTALVFKNDKFSTVGVAVAQSVQEEELKIYFDNEMPNFTESKDENQKAENKEKTSVKTEKSAAKIVKTDKKEIAVNINTAGIKELILLPGIGEATAQKIIDYRNENGKFIKIDDLKKVKGIGEKKFETVKNLLRL